ncbi:methionyl-tRNA formyltransferase [Polynucleobacter sp. JS-Polo-80-F4]|uniref:methionyl-tRNA formyltransferase n=1 Tax=Polynucleobacter sp. JS-Polo-80-F4 TaxID=2576918 RepID=UPI001C0DA7B3|nr:methionyl-tRNA formyltransferase [Polynucleobacter sp. JS-Polo-80-F4]MBU3616402.1 methionyl-tRNA formyltransferase [Polynucleobacter sp. JS-Polo-80-F4]
MKIVFAGTPEFAAQAMRAIFDAGHEIVLALTQPDRRAGRGMHLQASPVKEFALQNNIPVLQPETLRRNGVDPLKTAQAQAAYEHLSSIEFDAMVVVAYGLILPQEILDISEKLGRHGSFNIHASLLPRWRGAAPIQRAIESGDTKTGVCIMQMDAGLDTGDTVLIADLEIASDETSASLHDRLALLGSKLIVNVLNVLQQGKELTRVPQETNGITYAEKILKNEAEIDWTLDAKEIDQRIRAFNPFPGASSKLNGLAMKFWHSRPANSEAISPAGSPGDVLGFSGDGVYIQCGAGVVEVLEMQKPGGKKIDAKTCVQSIGEKQLRFQSKE